MNNTNADFKDEDAPWWVYLLLTINCLVMSQVVESTIPQALWLFSAGVVAYQSLRSRFERKDHADD